MAGEENVLVTRLEARIRDFEKQMVKAEKTAQKTYTQMRKGSNTATKQMAGDMERSTRRINQAMATTSRQAGAFSSAFGGIKGAALGAVAGVFSITRAFRGAQAAVAEFDKIAKTARDTGLDSDFYQALGLAANESSISQEKLNAALEVFTKNAGLAASGQGTLYTQLKKMNPELLKAFQNTSSQEERLRILADATANAATATEKAALATTAFGRTGVELTRILAGGSQGFDEVAMRARNLGIVIDKELLNSAEQLETKFGVASQVLRVNMQVALVELMPLLIDVARGAGAVAKQIAIITDNVSALENRSSSGIQRQIDAAKTLAQNNQGNWMGDMALDEIQKLQGELRSRAIATLNAGATPATDAGAFSRDNWLSGSSPALAQEPVIRDKITAAINRQGTAMDLLSGYTGRSLDQFGQLTDQQTKMSDVADDAFGTLISGLRSGEKFSDSLSKALDGVLDKLQQMASNALFGGGNSGIFGGGQNGFLGGLLNSIGGIGGGGAGSVASGASGITLGPLYHSGGIVGQSAVPARAVPSSTFQNAQRYHSGGIAGLKPDEIPAILQRGERVIPRNAVSQPIRSGPNVTVPPAQIEVNIIGGNDNTEVTQRQEGGVNVVDVVVGKVESRIGRGDMDQTFGSRFNARPSVKRR